MFNQLLTDLEAYLSSIPTGTALDDALKNDLIARVRRIGQGAPQAAGGSGYGALEEDLTGPGGRYPAPAGPAGPPPPPPPPVVPNEPPDPID